MPELLQIIHRGDVEALQKLLDKGKDINFAEKGKNALTEAVKNKQIEVVEFLIKNGAKVNPTKVMVTPLIQSILVKNIKIMNILIEKGANINQNNDSYTPLTAAIDVKNTKAFDLLIRLGADVNKGVSGAKGFSPGSPLHMSIGKGFNFTKILLAKGAVHESFGEIETPLMTSVRNRSLSSVQTFIDHGVDVNVTNQLGDHALSIACSIGAVESVKLLLEKSNLSSRNIFHHSALDIAKNKKNKEIASMVEAHLLNQAASLVVALDHPPVATKNNRARI